MIPRLLPNRYIIVVSAVRFFSGGVERLSLWSEVVC